MRRFRVSLITIFSLRKRSIQLVHGVLKKNIKKRHKQERWALHQQLALTSPLAELNPWGLVQTFLQRKIHVGVVG